jgi:proteasome lid subunit RPN8/RPN11
MFPRTSRTAYRFEPREWLHVTEEAEQHGEQVICVFHSHGDAGAYFSAEDREMAAPEGEPLLPGVCYVVVAVDRGQATAARRYDWEEGSYQETTLFDRGPLPPSG